MVGLRAFADRNFAAGCAFSLILGVGLYGLTYLYPVFLARVRGYSALQIGETMFVTGACMFIMAPVAGRLSDSHAPGLMGGVGLALGLDWRLALVVMLAGRPAGPVRVRYTLQHALSATEDTIPPADREAVAKYAAALLCEQLASFYASDTDSTISADRSFGQTRSQAFAARAREYRKQFQAALGIDEKTAAPAGAVVQIQTTDSRGRSRMFHGRG